MPSVSNLSIGANFAGNYAQKARHSMNASIMRLSSGNRTLAGGDSAGASMGNNLMAMSKSHYIAGRNAEDGISAALTAESALQEIAVIAMRLRELGIQADNKAFQVEATDIAAMDAEADALFAQVDAIVAETKFNGVALLGTSAVSSNIGASANGTNAVALKTSHAIESVTNITVAAGADITADQVLQDVAISLGAVAAGIAALKARQAVEYSAAANLEAAASRILDTDFARETASLTKATILNQSAMAMVAQANQAQSAILAVLQ
jgi:flagellin